MNSQVVSDSSNSFTGPNAQTLKQLASSLEHWRTLLPRDLQWDEDRPAAYPNAAKSRAQQYPRSLDPSLDSPQNQQRQQPDSSLFTSELNSEPIQYPYAYDMQVALLRTRYYYAKYMAHRPFIYKALHYPQEMTQEDAEGVADCLKVRCHNRIVTKEPY